MCWRRWRRCHPWRVVPESPSNQLPGRVERNGQDVVRAGDTHNFHENGGGTGRRCIEADPHRDGGSGIGAGASRGLDERPIIRVGGHDLDGMGACVRLIRRPMPPPAPFVPKIGVSVEIKGRIRPCLDEGWRRSPSEQPVYDHGHAIRMRSTHGKLSASRHPEPTGIGILDTLSVVWGGPILLHVQGVGGIDCPSTDGERGIERREEADLELMRVGGPRRRYAADRPSSRLPPCSSGQRCQDP